MDEDLPIEETLLDPLDDDDLLIEDDLELLIILLPDDEDERLIIDLLDELLTFVLAFDERYRTRPALLLVTVVLLLLELLYVGRVDSLGFVYVGLYVLL